MHTYIVAIPQKKNDPTVKLGKMEFGASRDIVYAYLGSVIDREAASQKCR